MKLTTVSGEKADHSAEFEKKQFFTAVNLKSTFEIVFLVKIKKTIAKTLIIMH